jgi:UPF0755 protein
MHKPRFWLTLAAFAAVTACEVPDSRPALWVRIPEGAPIEAVAETLAVHEVVQSASEFERFAVMGRKHLGIQPGLYPLRRGMPMGEVLVTLRRGTPEVRAVRIRERTTLAEVARQVERALGVPAESTIAAAADPTLLERTGAASGTVEGYLFPTLYRVRTEADAHEIVRQMVDTFAVRWRPEWSARLDELGLTRHELVTLASIIEGEMPLPAEAPYVSSVYHNRLQRGMRLQADPTVVYALGEWRRLSYDDLQIESEYNTYLIDGLPPGPINQPSTVSIVAALYPAPSDYLYFVAHADGRHLFSRSYREHLATIRQIRRPRSGGTSAPD